MTLGKILVMAQETMKWKIASRCLILMHLTRSLLATTLRMNKLDLEIKSNWNSIAFITKWWSNLMSFTNLIREKWLKPHLCSSHHPTCPTLANHWTKNPILTVAKAFTICNRALQGLIMCL
jgi:hypothetical protein